MTTEKCPETWEFNCEVMARLCRVPRWESLKLLRQIQRIYHHSGITPATVARIRQMLDEHTYKPGDTQFSVIRQSGGHYILAPNENKEGERD